MSVLTKFRKSIMLILKLMIILAMLFVFIEDWQTEYSIALFTSKGNYLVIFSYVAFLLIFSYLYGGLKIGTARLSEIIYSFSLAMIITNFFMYLELSLIARDLVAIPPILFSILKQFVIVVIGLYAANVVYFTIYRTRYILAIAKPNFERSAVITKMKKFNQRYKINKTITTDLPLDEIKAEINNYEAILIGDIEKNIQNDILKYCYANKKRIYLLPDSNDIIINNCHQSQIFDIPIFICRNRGLSIEQELIKRAMDVVFAAIGIIISSPIMLIVALSIKLYDGGPVFFKQNRVTKNGKIFNVLKFRSMIVDADKVKLRKATNNDDRITPIGKIIRPCRIDELPQLFNILLGDMSIVGPRPERTENVYDYTKILPEFDLRHRVKAGLTGYAQIYGKYNTSPQDKLNMDLIYIENYSLLLDIKIILTTIKILAMRESTEGFTEEDSVIGSKK